jgi:hypothetical protein
MTAIFATGCFHWAPASSLSSIEDDRVKVYASEHEITLAHATAHGRVIVGEPQEGGLFLDQSGDCAMPSCGSIDVTNAKVAVRRLNVPVTAAILAGSALLVAATAVFFGVLIAIASSQTGIP